MAERAVQATNSQTGGALGYFARRWRREVPLGLLFWRDMVIAGSLLNLACAFLALMALGLKAGSLTAVLIAFAPMPFNIFLVAAVWRAADAVQPSQATTARLGAALWLVLATVV